MSDVSTFERFGGAVEAVPLSPRIYINSFPKSGTHLGIMIAAHLARRQEPKHWMGSFFGNSWSSKWIPDKYILPVIRGQPAGTWMMGHLGYKPEFEQAFVEMGTKMIFIYRDLRDVAVSLTHHIENENDEKFIHPGKDLFRAMASHDERLLHVIGGINIFTGIIERWELYAEWLEIPWVLKIKYEDMRDNPHKIAQGVIDYLIKGVDCGGGHHYPLMISQNIRDAVDQAIINMGITEFSASFRSGRSGDWQTEFNQEHRDLFKERSGDWLIRLGYEVDNEW